MPLLTARRPERLIGVSAAPPNPRKPQRSYVSGRRPQDPLAPSTSRRRLLEQLLQCAQILLDGAFVGLEFVIGDAGAAEQSEDDFAAPRVAG